MNAQIETENATERVILVHGTFAGAPEDSGSKWWQKGSRTWHALSSVLGSNVELGPVFHWANGPNSYRARVEAGNNLLEKLLDLETTHTGYHLVGHSHGGSVIWEALRQAVFRRAKNPVSPSDESALDLPCLRSWTTVGTPFIDFAPKPPFLKMPVTTSHLCKRRLFIRLRQRIVDWWLRSYGLLFLILLVGALWSPFGATWSIYEEYQANPNMPVIAFLIGPLLSLIAFLFILVVGGFLIKLAELLQVGRERLLSSAAIEKYGCKWFGIFSKSDEAIAAMSASLNPELSIITKRQDVDPVFYSDKLYGSVHWVRRRLNWFYNLFVPKLGNQFINRQLSNLAQGSDRPGTVAVAVRNNPGWNDEFSLCLPEEVDRKLVELANEQAAELIPLVRSLLYSVNDSILQIVNDEDIDATSALVHNSYFQIDEVISMIAGHVLVTSRVADTPVEIDQSFHDWIKTFKKEFKGGIDFQDAIN